MLILFFCFFAQVGVSIQMSSFNLTRIITMSPFYNLINKSSYELEVGEVLSPTATRWHYMSSTEVCMNMILCRCSVIVLMSFHNIINLLLTCCFIFVNLLMSSNFTVNVFMFVLLS